MKDILKRGFDAMGIEYTDALYEKFVRYYELLVDYNTRVNLTAITAPHEVAVKHFLDSISLVSVHDIAHTASMIDVGTGAGFPGLPLKIVRGDIHLTLVDSLNKRVDFLKLCVDELELDNVECIHSRAEELARKDGYRESYDLAVSRAVANMSTLCEYCLPFVREGGHFAAFKGPLAAEELEGAKNAIAVLGGGNSCIKLTQTGADVLSHSIILVDKIAPTAQKYPRMGNKPLNKPL